MVFLSLLSLLITPMFTLTLAQGSGSGSSSSGSTSGYAVKTPPLATNWTYSVGTDPWPEYPRPQMTRSRWQSLNGVWTYKNASSNNPKNPPTGDLGHAVLVPSCLESSLSGIYFSAFKLPSVLMHFSQVSKLHPVRQ